MRGRARSFGPLSLAVLVGGCGTSEPAPRPLVLEIGVRGPDDAFVPLADGDAARLVQDVDGSWGIAAGLRAEGIEPGGVRPLIRVWVGGIPMAGDLHGESHDMVADGDGFVLWDVVAEFHARLCCYVCQDGVIEAELVDASDRIFEGDVGVRLARDACPDPEPDACCETADVCLVTSLARVCP